MISKETLMAYVDGELDERTRMEVEAAMTLDPEIMHEIDRQQMLRGQLRSAFDDVLREPVPERLLAAVGSGAPAAHKATVTDLSQARAAAAPKSPSRWLARHWLAAAASLVLGVFLGQQLWRAPDTEAFTTRNGQLVARGLLAQALTSRLSGEASTVDSVKIALSFKDTAGNYCRAFVIHNTSGLAGLACREGENWQLQVLAQAPVEPGNGENYRMAATALPATILQATQAIIQGEVLATAEEVEARDSSWR